MAERRMFAKTIVLSDAFLDLPMSARCLYFTLGMLADDDGFVNSPRSIMRQCGASDDDMKVLLAKKFVLLFESGVIVIKHWRINNYLRNDRYTETKYTDEKSELTIEENGAYRLGIPPGIPNMGIPSLVKDRSDKDRVGKDSVCSAHTREDGTNDLFEEFWAAYPRKTGEIRGAYLEYVHALDTGATHEQMMEALEWQTEEWNAQGSSQFIPSPEKWLKNRRWEEKKREPVQQTPKASLAQPITPVGTVDVGALQAILDGM